MVLIKEELDQIEGKIQEEITESWNGVEDRYDALLTSVVERIAELKILSQAVRQPAQIEEGIGAERQIEPTLALRLAQILVGAL